jgi:hypothetical protein
VAVLASVALGVALGAGSSDAVRPASAAASPAASSAPAQPFGATVTFEDGSTLTAGPPVAFRPDDGAFGGEDLPHHVKLRVTFVNNSDEVFDPALTVGSASSAGTPGQLVYSSEFDPPQAAVLPGKRVTWWVAFGVEDPKQVTFTTRMGFLDYEDVTFTNE